MLSHCRSFSRKHSELLHSLHLYCTRPGKLVKTLEAGVASRWRAVCVIGMDSVKVWKEILASSVMSVNLADGWSE